MELWGLKLTGSGYPQIFSVPIAVKLCVRPQTFYRCKNVLDVLYHYAKLGKTRISLAAGAAKNVEFFCLSVRLFVRHAFERQRVCARFRHEGFGLQKRFDTVG